MIIPEPEKIAEIYDYLRQETDSLSKADGAFVFCRDDPLVAERAAELYHNNLVDYIMFTGGIGSGSGYLAEINLPEAHWQKTLAVIGHRVPPEKIYIESTATNGVECCLRGIDTIVENSLPHENLIMTLHPTSLRRAMALMQLKEKEKGFETNWQMAGTDYFFNSHNVLDQKEAVAELLRLADWPKNTDENENPDPWCVEQPDLPLELVEYARELQADWKSKQ
jgi:hypothetical protein